MSLLTYANLAIGLALAVLAIVLYLIVLYLRNPVLIRIGLRNIPRRPTQSILIVVGLTLSTIIIVSSLAVGDTLSYSLRRQAVDAYGAIDEILAPPILSLFVTLANEESSSAEVTQAQEQLTQLTEGGLTTALTVLSGGLPSISEARFRQLQVEAQQDDLIDGVAGAIVFPTIVHDVTSGQGEPYGFIFAVDDDYDQQFGLVDVTGAPVALEELEPGVGNIFAQASNLFANVRAWGGRAGLGGVTVSDIAVATAAVGAALTAGGEEGIDLSTLNVDLATLQQLGIDTTPLEEAGLETLSLEALGLSPDRLATMGVLTTTVSLGTALEAAGVDASVAQTMTTDLLGALNLNTLGRELDALLAQAGLQLRQGDVYLNRLGAERLAARTGDVLEVYIGPIPIPFRVKGIVEQAGPMAALAPVVMLRLSEAQKLLFMRDKVNAILVSNRGDELAGIEQTAAVSRKLRVLALDPAGLEKIAAILRRPETRAVIDARAPEVVDMFGGEFEGPVFLRTMVEDVMQAGDFAELVHGLPAALEEPGVSDALRTALASQSVREWLFELPLDAATSSELTGAFALLNQFDLIDPLNKASVVTVAGVGGTVFTSIFSLFGFFSMLAGVLLIFLIFVMLAAERRSEMGMARAIGVQRTHLVRMFMTEGLVYDLLAAALGVLLGLAVSYLMIGFIGGLFNRITGQISEYGGAFTVRFQTAPTSIVIGYCIGVLFTFVVVLLAARRVSRLNIVAAIRDLPDVETSRRVRVNALGGWLVAVLLAVGGGALITLGIEGRFSVLLAGVTCLLSGVMLLIERLLAWRIGRVDHVQRLVYSVIGLGLLVIWGLPWAEWFNRTVMTGDGPWILVSFALTMPMIILGAILVVMFNAQLLTGLVSIFLGRVGALTPVLKTAIAYPLSARFRTGMAMLLFAMVISTVTIMTVVIEATQTLVTPDRATNAGFEIATSFSIFSFLNPAGDLEAEMATNPDYPAAQVAAVGALATGMAEAQRVEMAGDGWRRLPLTGVNSGYLDQAETTYRFALRAAEFDTDAALWEALRTRDDVGILTSSMVFETLSGAQGAAAVTPTVEPPVRPDEIGEPDFEHEMRGGRRLFGDFALDSAALPPITLLVQPIDSSLPPHTIRIIGVLDAADTLAPRGLQVGAGTYAALTGEPFVGDSYYFKTAPGADVHAVAQAVERAFVSNGLNASVMAEQFAQGQALMRGIMRLFQGFMALGLLVGIAALGVISSRSVVERRQQVGMLRAIGFQPRMVALAFLLEASFIAVAGLLIGALAGVVLGRSLVRTFFFELADGRVLATPWWQIAGIVLLAYFAALLATLVPAYQASRVYPAEALRYE